MKPRGNLFTIAAPSGAGKTSLVKSLVENTDNLAVSVSHTTRAKRPGEQHAVNYYFVEQKEFDQMIAKDQFLEHATVFEKNYGTARSWVLDKLAKGIDVILEIDWQGCRQVREVIPDTISIFILPPSLPTLRERLKLRGQDENAIIEKRMIQARGEISHFKEYDYLVINDDFNQAVADLKAIIFCQRLTLTYQQERHRSLLDELLTT